MKQQITLSKNIIKYLFNSSLLTGNSQMIFKHLRDNLITTDINKVGIQQITSELKKSNISIDEKKTFLEFLIKNTIPINYNCNENEFNELELSYNSKDKIYFNPCLSIIELSKIFEENPLLRDVEIHDLKSFEKPRKQDKLKHLPNIIILEKNEKYNLAELLEPYFRDEYSITVLDPYIANDNAFFNLLKLCEIINKKAVIKIHTLIEEVFVKYHIDNRAKYERFINYVNGNPQIYLNFIIYSKHQERYIKTSKAHIFLPGGLDCIRIFDKKKNKILEKGYPNISYKYTDYRIFITPSEDNIENLF